MQEKRQAQTQSLQGPSTALELKALDAPARLRTTVRNPLSRRCELELLKAVISFKGSVTSYKVSGFTAEEFQAFESDAPQPLKTPSTICLWHNVLCR